MSKRKAKKPSKKSVNLKHFLTNKLRRASYAWPPRKAAIVAARVSRGKYKCFSCEGLFGPKQIQLDHTIPVIDPHVGFVDWNTYIERLFCDTESFKVLCRECHAAKTHFENGVRTQVKSMQDPDDDV